MIVFQYEIPTSIHKEYTLLQKHNTPNKSEYKVVVLCWCATKKNQKVCWMFSFVQSFFLFWKSVKIESLLLSFNIERRKKKPCVQCTFEWHFFLFCLKFSFEIWMPWIKCMKCMREHTWNWRLNTFSTFNTYF